MKVKKIIVMILTVCMIVTYMPVTAYAGGDTPDVSSEETPAVVDAASSEEITIDAEYLEENCREDILEEESGLDYNTYDLGDGMKAQVFFSYPVRYEDENGDMIRIEPELVSLDSKNKKTADKADLQGYAYENKSGEYKTFIPETLSSNTPILLVNDRYTFTMVPSEEILNETGSRAAVDDMTATYGTDSDDIKLEYISQNDGIEENIILNERPDSNEFTFELSFANMTYRMNPTDKGISFYDEDTDEIVMGIAAPFMNDATGEAYSEDLEYEVIEPSEGEDTYTLKLKVSDKYLDDPSRVYPITIDPTAYWVGTSQVRDAYVISSFPTTNFYSSSTMVMPSGHGTQGVHRTYIHILNLKSQLIGANISSATFDIYETGGGRSGYFVRMYRITEDWVTSSVTWNNKPSIASDYIYSLKTDGTANHKMSYNVTTWAKNVVSEKVNNYGLCLRNKTETGTSYTEFYGTRTGATSYRPKLTVVYTDDKPTQPTKVKTDTPYALGNTVYVNWEGVKANKLDKIQYKIAKLDSSGNITNSNYVPYTAIGSKASSGRHSIPGSADFPKGYYRVYIRGLSKMGVTGNSRSARFRIEDKPTTPSSVTISPASIFTGDTINVSWTGLTGSFLSEAQYKIAKLNSSGGIANSNYVPYSKLKSNPSASGSAAITGKITDPGTYKIYVRGKNGSGIVGGAKASDPITVLQDNAPVIGSVTLSKGNDVVDPDIYITPGNISVNVTGITDDASLSGRTGTYTLKRGDEEIRTGNVSLTGSSGTYSAAFLINSSYINQTGEYALYFNLTDSRGNGASVVKTFKVDNTDPAGSIIISDYIQDNMKGITANISDEGSGIDEASLDLYRIGTNNQRTFVCSLASSFTLSKLVDIDTLQYPNGDYQLELNISDKAGNETTVTENIAIANALEALDCEIAQLNNQTIRINWEYTGDRQDLRKVRYSVNGGTETDINVTGTSGYFDVQITGISGTGYILIKGVDASGIEGKTRREEFTIDPADLYVNISSVTNGLVMGSVTDDDLDKWEIFIKASNASDDTYVKLTEGTNVIVSGMICAIELDSTYPSGTYTVKLKAEDNKGNIEECTHSYTHTINGIHVTKTAAGVSIRRELDQDKTLDTFTVPSNASSISLETPTAAVSGKWYVDNSKVSDSLTYQPNLSSFQENVSKSIFFIGTDSSGQKVMSADLYKDSKATSGSLGLLEDGEIEEDVVFSEDVTAFSIAFTEKPGVSYYVKAGNGDYTDLYPYTLIFVSDLDQNICETDTVTILAESDLPARLGSYTAYGAVVNKEYFKVSSIDSYYPSNFRAVDKINYKTYLSWEVPETIPNDISYEVYRSTDKSFIPGETTLMASGIREGYYVDINVSYGQDFYYKVRAVKEGSLIADPEYSLFTKTKRSRAIDEDEYTKELGIKDHLSYTEVATPKGTGYIEKSKGNFAYVTADAVIANELLPVEISRTYNSESTSKSILGYGWTMRYDMGILKLVDSNDAENGALALRDGDGTIYTFRRSESNSSEYVSRLGRYIKLTAADSSKIVSLNGVSETIDYSYIMRTREGVRYYFDSFGRLVITEESNGHIVISRYDPNSGLLSEIVTDKGLSVSLVYNNAGAGNDAYTVREITLPDGSKISYSYEDSYLTEAEYIPYGETSGISEEYSYTEENDVTRMTELTDGEENEYDVSYGQNSVTFAYPGTTNRESARVSYGEGYSISERLIGNTVVSREHDDIEGSQVIGSVIMGDSDIHQVTDTEDRDVTYNYQDGLLTEESERIYHSILPEGMIGDILTASNIGTETYEYNDGMLIGEDGRILGNDAGTTITYSNSGEWNGYLPTSVTETAGNTELVNERYVYDSKGNVTAHYDYISGEHTAFTYYGDDPNDDPRFSGRLKTRTDSLLDGNTIGDTISVTTVNLCFDNNGNKEETITVVKGDKTTKSYFKYDPMGRLLITRSGSNGAAEGTLNVTELSYIYDGYGRVVTETSRTYFGDSGLDEVSDVKGNRTARTYDSNGTVLTETASHYDENDGYVMDSVIYYTYDELNRLTVTETKDAGGTTLSKTRKDYSYVTDLSINDGKAGRTIAKALRVREYEGSGNGELMNTSYYDGLGRVVRDMDGDGVTTDYGFDRNGEAITEYLYTDSACTEGILTLTCYDEEGNEIAEVIDPSWNGNSFTLTEDSVITKASYDVNGNMISQTDALGNTTIFTYDEEDRVTSVNLPDTDNETTFDYSEDVDDDDDNYTETVLMTDALGHEKEEISDSDGKIIRLRDIGDSSEDTPIVTDFAFDGDGNLLSESHSEGDHLDYTYDSKGRLIEKKEFDSNNHESRRTVYTYFENNDQVESMSDYTVSGETETLYHYEAYSYDDLGRMITKAEYQGDTLPQDLSPYTLTYTYDDHDNITSIAYGSAIPSEVDAVEYVYSGDRLSEVKVRVGNTRYTVKEYTYTSWGAVKTVKDYYDFKESGITKYIILDYTYNDLLNVSEMVYTKEDDTVIESHRYTYDKAGKIISEENSSSLSDLNEIRRYEYDTLGRLVLSDIKDIEEVTENGETDISEENKVTTSYNYDKVGNRVSKTENGTETVYVYNGLDQLISETEDGDTLTYSYDLNGNQIGISGTSDGETISRSFTYTPSGMMETYADDNTVLQTNTYSGEGQRIRKEEGISTTNYFYQEGSVLYTTGDNSNFNLLNYSDIFGTVRDGDDYYFYLEDIQGSTTDLIDSAADMVVSYWYNDFGEVTEDRETDFDDFVNEIQYTGAIYDDTTSLLYLNARFYEPSTGRFISQDTYRGEPEEPDTWHLYAYCANDPVNYVDPSGHKKDKLTEEMVKALLENNVTKALFLEIRTIVSVASSAFLSAKGYKLSKKMFNNNIWGGGKGLKEGAQKLLEKKIKGSKKIKNKVKKMIKKKKHSGSCAFTKGDLYYSVRKCNIELLDKIQAGRTIYRVKVYDRYDFSELDELDLNLSDMAVALGWALERAGITHPYDWEVRMTVKI